MAPSEFSGESLSPGEQLGRYRIDGLLGEGGACCRQAQDAGEH